MAKKAKNATKPSSENSVEKTESSASKLGYAEPDKKDESPAEKPKIPTKKPSDKNKNSSNRVSLSLIQNILLISILNITSFYFMNENYQNLSSNYQNERAEMTQKLDNFFEILKSEISKTKTLLNNEIEEKQKKFQKILTKSTQKSVASVVEDLDAVETRYQAAISEQTQNLKNLEKLISQKYEKMAEKLANSERILTKKFSEANGIQDFESKNFREFITQNFDNFNKKYTNLEEKILENKNSVQENKQVIEENIEINLDNFANVMQLDQTQDAKLEKLETTVLNWRRNFDELQKTVKSSTGHMVDNLNLIKKQYDLVNGRVSDQDGVIRELVSLSAEQEGKIKASVDKHDNLDNQLKGLSIGDFIEVVTHRKKRN